MNRNDILEDADVIAHPGQPSNSIPATTNLITGDPALPTDPADFLQDLVKQTQLLACLQWLGEFQILAFISLTQQVAYTVLADLTGVPAAQIQRIVRTTATVGFLCEPQPDHVAHTPLSIQFLKRPSCLDALKFIAETVVPTALHMAEATRRDVHHQQVDTSSYQIAMHSSFSLAAECENDAKLQRRASAFQRLEAVRRENAVTHLLSSIDWEGLGQATVVEVNAVSTATAKALSARNSALRFLVQMRDDIKSARVDSLFATRQSSSTNKVIVQGRVPGTPQNERSAAIYLLHIPDPLFFTSSVEHAEICKAELWAHFELLRANNGNCTLILIAGVLPDSNTRDTPTEAVARLQDLLLLQMGHKEVFDLPRLMGMLEAVCGDTGRLTVVNQLSSPGYPMLAFELRDLPLSR